MNEQDFGRRLRDLRHTRQETLDEVAKATGLSIAMLSRVERGERLPSPESVEVLAKHFELPAEELMSDTIASKMMNRYGRESSSRAAERMQGAERTWGPAESDGEFSNFGTFDARSPAPEAGTRASAGPRLPMQRAGMTFSARPIEALFDEDVARDSLSDAAHVAEVALQSAMRAVRRAQASGDPDQIEEAERVLARLRRAVG